MWITTPIPLGATGLLILVLMLLLGIAPNWAGATGGFANNAVFFAVAIFCLPVVVMKTKWGIRLVGWLVERVHENSRKLILLFMITCALLSTVLSDFCVTIIFYGFALTILKAANADPAHSNLGKCLMIGIPVAAVTGGIATPAGSSFNVVAMNILTQATGGTISFLDWAIVGLPVAIVMTPISWFFITTLIKPEPIADSCLQGIRDEAAASKTIAPYDIKAITIIVLLVALWIIGNWVPIFNATLVALIGLAVMFMPGMNLLTWKEFQDSVPWGIVLMCGTIMTMGGVVQATGGAKFLADAIMGSGVTGLGFFACIAILFALIYLLHTVCPVGVAILGIFLPIMIALCGDMGYSAAVPTIGLAVIVAGNYLMPVNPTVMLTFGEGYYTFGDMFKTGLVPAVALIVLITFWVPFIVGVLGI